MSELTVDTRAPDEVPPRAPIEWRRGGDLEVHWAERVIELVVVPYNFDAVVEYPPNSGRYLVEECLPGAFDGVERRANRVKANRDHDETRTIGRAMALHPSRTEGLVGEVRISKTLLGDETLALADDRVLEVSAGLAVMPSWQDLVENRTRRRIRKAFLDHIALLPNGAYAEGAQVLDVRNQLPPPAPTGFIETPNLDEVMAWMQPRG